MHKSAHRSFVSVSSSTALVWLVVAGPGAVEAQTEIHKCTDADGGITYSQLPCPPAKADSPDAAEAAENTEEDSASTDEDDYVVFQVEDRAPRSAEEVAACKKKYRDQIDAIDAEMKLEYSADKADNYKQRLLQLTRQLRLC